MPFISVTRLRIRSIRFLPPFALHAFRGLTQARKASGFQGGSLLAERARTFWTMTAWDGEDDMRQFMVAGAHAKAMPHLPDWCDEASVVHWVGADGPLPPWTEADRRMREGGRPSKVRNPTSRHANLGYARPRTTGALTIRPAKPR